MGKTGKTICARSGSTVNSLLSCARFSGGKARLPASSSLGSNWKTRVSPAGLTARGSGALDVVTAPVYQPGAGYRVVQGGPPSLLHVGADGRLRFTVDLGPSHPSQQRAFDPAATAGWRQVTVQIAAA